jgi:hypothetical protein
LALAGRPPKIWSSMPASVLASTSPTTTTRSVSLANRRVRWEARSSRVIFFSDSAVPLAGRP